MAFINISKLSAPSFSNQSKNSATFTNIRKSDILIWNDATKTWEEETRTWDQAAKTQWTNINKN